MKGNSYIIALILILFLCLNVSAEVSTVVLSKINTQNEVKVIVTLNKVGNLSSKTSGDKQQKFKILDSIARINRVQQDSVISSLKPSDFRVKIKSKSGTWFAGWLTKTGLSKLENDPRIRDIHHSFKVYPMLDFTTSLINASYAWNLNYTGHGQRICVIDSGVDYHNPYLGNCSQVGENCKIVDGYDKLMGDDDTEDDHGHGTRVVGMIISNDTQYQGVAPGSEIVMMKIFNTTQGYDIEEVGDAIEDCILEPYTSTIISISLGTNETFYNSTNCLDTIKDSIDWAYDHGAFIAIASGNQENQNGISYPACEPNATSVGAVYTKEWGEFSEKCTDASTSADKITCFTNRGENLDILAPGAYITSTEHDGPPYLRDHLWGTSLSTPIVAGGAAILREINPDFTPDQIKYILTNTGKQVTDVGATGLTFPRIDLYNATLIALRSGTVEIKNDGNNYLNISTINTTYSWIVDITPTSFNLAENETKDVLITIDEEQINIGTESGTIDIYSNDPDESVKSVQVILKKIKPGYTGVTPPGSGDWIIDEYTAVWFNETQVDGGVEIQSGNTLFLGETFANVTDGTIDINGTLNLDSSTLILG